jgi:pimeloyl-ACP methyl ester carboxylesterase
MAPNEQMADLAAGRFRVLTWTGSEPAVLFLHGLTGVAEVWGPTVAALGEAAPTSYAMDQRGHGHSAKPANGYAIADFVRDLAELVAALGLDQPHLVGHSMGARVAMVAASRRPELFRSVAIVDIGPEEWKDNWQSTVLTLDRLPESWPNAEAAIGRSGTPRGRAAEDPALTASALTAIARARLNVGPDGSARWLASIDALKKTVVSHRSRNFWREWSAISIPAMLVRGSESDELRPFVAARMRAKNPRVRFEEISGAGHNIPLIAPTVLAELLQDFWRANSR